MAYPTLSHHQVKSKLIEWWNKQELTCKRKYMSDNGLSNYLYLSRLAEDKICTTSIKNLICTHEIKEELQEYIDRGQITKATESYLKLGLYREKALRIIGDGNMSMFNPERLTFTLYIKDEEPNLE